MFHTGTSLCIYDDQFRKILQGHGGGSPVGLDGMMVARCSLLFILKLDSMFNFCVQTHLKNCFFAYVCV